MSAEVIAHRGASAVYGDNTIAAFAAAGAQGATWVELDIRRFGADRLIVSHDPYAADGRRLIDLTSADRSPALVEPVEAFEACGGLGIHVEIKNLPSEPGFDPDLTIVTDVLALIGERIKGGDPRPWSVSSFHAPTVRAARDLADRDALAVSTALLARSIADPRSIVAAAVTAGHGAIHPSVSAVSDELITAAHGAGLGVNVWTVNDPVEMARLVGQGVDGLFTDYPDRAHRVISS